MKVKLNASQTYCLIDLGSQYLATCPQVIQKYEKWNTYQKSNEPGHGVAEYCEFNTTDLRVHALFIMGMTELADPYSPINFLHSPLCNPCHMGLFLMQAHMAR